MESSLSPQPSDTTNALLKVLINKVANGTFTEQEASLPIWTGPGSVIVWIQALAYTSLSMSLLAAFGGVLVKQWLGNFKASRFGQGDLRERCMRRQNKLDGLKNWRFNAVVAALPILLQLSLWFFGVALAANVESTTHRCRRHYGNKLAWSDLLLFHCHRFIEVAGLSIPDPRVDGP
jgi:Family of unknown function (DUF6535)